MINQTPPNKLEFPLIVGPGEGKPIEEFETFMSKLLEPRYTAAKGSVEEQVDGEDPILEVEEIVGKRGSKKKSMKYQVKWKGSKVLTWEPLSHLKGASKAIKEYESKQKYSK